MDNSNEPKQAQELANMNNEILAILTKMQKEYKGAPEERTITMNLKTVSSELNRLRIRVVLGEDLIPPNKDDQPGA